jgi:outer membrane protein assembly factor BamB
MSSASGLAMDGRNVYVTDEKGAVHALDRYSGSSIWKQDKLYMRDVTGPAIRRGLVVVADGEGMVHFLSREDGAFSSRLATGGSPIQMAPRELESNFLVQNQKGELIAIEVQ